MGLAVARQGLIDQLVDLMQKRSHFHRRERLSGLLLSVAWASRPIFVRGAAHSS
jgi:hypothetical protein